MAAFGKEELVDPLISGMHGEEVITMNENIFSKALGIASLVSHSLMNRSSVPDAMPADNPVPTPVKRKIVEKSGPARDGRVRQLVNATGLDGETFKHVVGSVGCLLVAPRRRQLVGILHLVRPNMHNLCEIKELITPRLTCQTWQELLLAVQVLYSISLHRTCFPKH